MQRSIQLLSNFSEIMTNRGSHQPERDRWLAHQLIGVSIAIPRDDPCARDTELNQER
jgi:hypothetical protein